MNKQSNTERPIVVHFIGAGRSGSTLLNIILDNHPQIMGTGELLFLVRSWVNGDYCSCAQPLSSCPFWSTVFSEWLRRTGMNSPNEYLALQKMYERYRRLPRYLFGSVNSSEEFRKYSAYTSQLFQVIRELSDARVIVDSSKNPARVLSLTMVPDIDLRVIFLVRDVRGFSWSKQKEFHKNQQAGLGWSVKPSAVWKSSVEWTYINLLSEWILKKAERSLFIRHEDLLHNPEPTLSKIGCLIEMDLTDLAIGVQAGQTLAVNHIAAGNRLRMKKEIKLHRNETWKVNMPSKDQNLAWTLTGWLMKRYGYSSVENDT